MEGIINKPVDGALFLFDKGFKVFPLKPNEKIPSIIGWQNWAKTATQKKIQDFGKANPLHNWGVYCGISNLIVIDIDNKKNKSGLKTITELSHKKKHFPPTLQIKTPTGGFHYYYIGQSISGVNVLGKGVDIKSKGGYVVAPGSRIGTCVYKIIHNIEILNIPSWILKDIKKEKKPKLSSLKKIPGIKLDQKHHIERAIRYLKEEAPPSIEGEGGNNTLYQVACQVKNLGITLNLAKQLIDTYFDPRCIPNWLNTGVENKKIWDKTITSAYQHSQEPAGSKTPEFEFMEIKKTYIGPKHISEFKGKPPKRQWLIKDWFPLNEISSMYGKGGAGKSLLALQLALSVTTGQEFMGLKIKRAMPALCVFCEDSDTELHRRKHSIVAASEFDFVNNIDKAPLYLWARAGENNDIAKINSAGNDVIEGSFMPFLVKALDDMPPGNKLLILDTLSDIYLGNENVREQVNKFIKTFIGSLVQKYSLTVLLLAHPSRVGASSGDQLSGSTAWENSVRNRLSMTYHKDFPEVTCLKRIKSNYAKTGEEILMRWEEGRFKLVDLANIAATGIDIDQQEVLEVLCKYMIGFERRTLHEVASTIQIDPDVAHLFKGKDILTVKRYIKKALQYPRRIENDIYFYENASIIGHRGKHWVCKRLNPNITKELQTILA